MVRESPPGASAVPAPALRIDRLAAAGSSSLGVVVGAAMANEKAASPGAASTQGRKVEFNKLMSRWDGFGRVRSPIKKQVPDRRAKTSFNQALAGRILWDTAPT